MKRRGFVAAAGLAAMSPLCAAPAPRPSPLRLQPVAPGIWFVHGDAALGSPANRNFISNAGVVITRAGVIVIDALGSPALAEALIGAIRGLTRQPLRWVIVTHYHADHIYGLQAFKARGAQVIAHAGGREYLASDAAERRLEASRAELAPWVNAKTRLVAADRWIDGDTVLVLGGQRLQLRHVGPAHTGEDLAVFVERSRVLFCGDLVFRGRVPFVGTADSSAWIASLDRLAADRPAILVPGHGPLSTDAAADLQLTRDYLVHLRKTMGEAAANLEPFEDAYARTDWSRFEHLPLFKAANRMNAYNTYLLMEQQPARAPR
jgi:glyoxylase-like metal-dependent hydrolase (beta-lactamase superfamily II)